jgi:iron complex outermembrane receptor protein
MRLVEVFGDIRASKRQLSICVHLAVGLLLAIAWLATGAVALAGDLNAVVKFNISAEALDKALLQFGAQAHLQLSFASDSVASAMQVRQLKGSYTAKEALEKLLRGTGLRYVARERTIEILPEDYPRKSDLPQPSSGSRADVHGPLADQSSADMAAASKAPIGTKTEGSPLHAVIVTGSRLPTTSKYGPQEIQTYDLERITQSGQTSISDFLSTLAQVSVFDNDETNLGQQSTVRLRGLPAGTTLVLLNGRRLEGSGFSGGSFSNLDDLPLAAVQRIEVVPTGSSAIYGADAIAGVVNIILKKDFDGVAANVKYGSAKDFGTFRSSVALGKQWSRGGISVIGSFGSDDGFLRSQRLLTASNDYRAFGGLNNNYPVCFPGNVFSSDGTQLPGAPAGSGATYAAVTGSTSSGRPGFANFLYGSLNECSFFSGESVLPSTHQAGVLIQGHFEVSPAVEVFAEVMYSSDNVDIGLGSPSLFGIPGFQAYTVSAANPYNPFGEAVGVAAQISGVTAINYFDTDFFRPLVGLKGVLGDRWQWEVTTWQSTDWTQSIDANAEPNASSIQSALNSSDPATALNVFVKGPSAPPAVLKSLFANENIKFMGRDQSAEAFLRGPTLSLPAGSIDVVVGADDVHSTLNQNNIYTGSTYPPNYRLNYQRRYDAVFGEGRIPLIGSVGNMKSRFMTLTVAARHDHYSDFGSANTDQFGLEIRPGDSLLMRGTYAEAFKAPTLGDLYSAQTGYQTFVKDPATGAIDEVTAVVGGNPNLLPLTGHSRSFGVVYSSKELPGLLLSVTQWNVVENNVIQSVAPQVIVDEAVSFPDRIIRNAVGQLGEVIGTEVNFGAIDVAGLDYQLNYRHSVGRGAWSINLDATEVYHYLQALVPGAVPIESASVAQDDSDWAPRWKGTMSMNLEEGTVTVHLDGRYTGSYEDYDSARRIGNLWILDTNVRWGVGRLIGASSLGFRGSYLEVGATNLFNKAPQFSNYLDDEFGYDPSEMSIVGRLLYLDVGVNW